MQYWNNTFFFLFSLFLSLSLVRLSPLQGMPSFSFSSPCHPSLLGNTHLSSLHHRNLWLLQHPTLFRKQHSLFFVVSNSLPSCLLFTALLPLPISCQDSPFFSLLNPLTSWLCRPLSPGLNNPLTTLCLHPRPLSNLF